MLRNVVKQVNQTIAHSYVSISENAMPSLIFALSTLSAATKMSQGINRLYEHMDRTARAFRIKIVNFVFNKSSAEL
jgi:hypothetical protein